MGDSQQACGIVRQLIKDQNNKWKAELHFNIAKEGDAPNVVDLVEFIVPHRYDERFKRNYEGYPPHTRLRFPSKYKGWETKDKLVKDLCGCALNDGYKLMIRSSISPGSKRSGDVRIAFAQLACDRSTLYQEQRRTDRTFEDGAVGAKGIANQRLHQSEAKRARPKTYRTTTKKTREKEYRCPFSFTIFLGSGDRWYLSVAIRKQEDPTLHMGHPKRDHKLSNSGTQRLPSCKRTLQIQLEDSGLPSADQGCCNSLGRARRAVSSTTEKVEEKEREVEQTKRRLAELEEELDAAKKAKAKAETKLRKLNP